jgi:hypothetical protein
MTVIHPDGSQTITLVDPTLLVNTLPPVPGLVVVNGRTVIDQSPTGDQTLASFHGTVTLDVRAALSWRKETAAHRPTALIQRRNR